MRRLILLLVVFILVISVAIQAEDNKPIGDVFVYQNVVNKTPVEIYMTGTDLGGYTINYKWYNALSESIIDTVIFKMKYYPGKEINSVEIAIVHSNITAEADINKDGKVSKNDLFDAYKLFFIK